MTSDAGHHFLQLFRALRGVDDEVDLSSSTFEAARWLDERPAETASVAAGDEDWARLEALSRRIDPHLTEAARPASQASYEEAVRSLFATFDELEAELDERRWLGTDAPSPADWWLFVHLVRLDLVYYGLYKCNLRRLVDYPNLYAFTRDLFVMQGVAETVDAREIVRSMYLAAPDLEPKGVPPLSRGPDFWWPSGRSVRFGGTASTRGTEESGARRRPGEWVRKQSGHRSFITRDGSSGFPAESGRYHLYVSNNCPWSHRANLTRTLKGLDDVISMDVLYFRRDPDNGWQFRPDEPGCTPDTLFGSRYLIEIYERVGSKERSVPVLFDKETNTIVSNESAEIIRMFDRAYDGDRVLYPEEHAAEIDEVNAWTYVTINNGAYKAGFTSSAEAHEDAYHRMFAAFEQLDRRLADRRYLIGDDITEADVRLFPTIFRFDPIYFTRFRLNERMVKEHANLQRWLDDMVAIPGVLEASNLDHCRRGYFGRTGNNIVPLGPDRRD